MMKKDPFIKSGLFGYGPYLYLCLDEKDFVRTTKGFEFTELNTWLIPGSVATAHSFENSSKFIGIVCLDLSQAKDFIDVTLTIVHEAIHIWQKYLAYIGEDKPGKEVEAYCIQHLVEIFLLEFERKKPREE